MKFIKIKLALQIFFLFLTFNTFGQSASINDNGAVADSMAILDIDISTNNKGVLIPRLTSAQLTSMGVVTTGMLVFNESVNDFQYYNGSTWKTVGHTHISNKIQDADADTKIQTEESSNENKIRFDVSGTEKIVIDNIGMGIGTATPSANLDVVGTFQYVNGTQGKNKYLRSDSIGNASWVNDINSTSGMTLNIRTISAGTTALATDNVVICNAAAGSYTVFLPPAANNLGRIYTFKKLGSGNQVTIDANLTETIDNILTYALTASYKSVRIISDGSRWHILGGF